MASPIWLGLTDNWSAGTNWSGGSAPGASDSPQFIRPVAYGPATNMPASALDHPLVVIGGEYNKGIGTSAAPWLLGSVSVLRHEARRAAACHLQIGNAETLGNLYVDEAGTAGLNSLVLGCTGTGAIAALHLRGRGSAQLIASAVVSAIYMQGNAPATQLYMASGATITRAVLGSGAGVVTCLAAVTTIDIAGGRWDHLGNSTFDVTTLNGYGGVFNFFSDGGTIGTANLFGALLDANGGSGLARAITTANLFGGTLDKRGKGSTLVVSAENYYGGRIEEGAMA